MASLFEADAKLLINAADTTGVNARSHLEGKYVLIYFSAHWCGPCRNFTPVLANLYTELKAKRSDFEFVFCSSDSDEAEFLEYYKTMPWTALPFDEKAAIESKFTVDGIPTLIVVGPDGKTISEDAVQSVRADPHGTDFPWKPQSLWEILDGVNFLTKEGSNQPKNAAELRSKQAFGIYFSAHWCPPCRGFTPALAEAYKHIKAGPNADNMDILFVSSDRSEEEFQEYFAEMPWIAIPHGDSRIAKLKQLFKVNGIPTFITLNADGSIINAKARNRVAADPTGEQFPWAPVPPPLVSTFDRDENTIDPIREGATLVTLVLFDAKSSTEAAEKQFREQAAQYAAAHPGAQSHRFFVTKTEGVVVRPKDECPQHHPLKKENPPYGGGRYNCDLCGNSFAIEIGAHRCAACQFDLCEACYEKAAPMKTPSCDLLHRVAKDCGKGDLSDKEAPFLVALNLKSQTCRFGTFDELTA